MTQTTVLKLALAGMVGLFCLSFAVGMRPTHANARGGGNYSGFLLHSESSANHPVIAQINNETGDFRVCELTITDEGLGAGLASSCSSWADGSGEYQLFPRKKFQ